LTAFVTGAAGFVGSNLTDRLLALGHAVVGYDNFSTGRIQFLAGALENPGFCLHRGDLLDLEALTAAMAGSDFVYHLASNADVRFGTQHPRRDLEQSAIGTWNVLEAMRSNNVRRIAFASSGSVYGEPEIFPTPEVCPFPIQTSLYGASKLAAEAFIQAYSEGFGIEAWIFRFVSLLGPRYSHGHVIDFYRQLREHPGVLNVLGDGHQRKSYLYIGDCIEAILTATRQASAKVNIFNLGTDQACAVNDSIGWICERLGLSPRLMYSGGKRGWIGDSPFILLDCDRIRSLGWRPALSIQQAVVRTVEFLEDNKWLVEPAPAVESLPILNG
jgi:UDP-glucose 4-epimerase